MNSSEMSGSQSVVTLSQFIILMKAVVAFNAFKHFSGESTISIRGMLSRLGNPGTSEISVEVQYLSIFEPIRFDSQNDTLYQQYVSFFTSDRYERLDKGYIGPFSTFLVLTYISSFKTN